MAAVIRRLTPSGPARLVEVHCPDCGYTSPVYDLGDDLFMHPARAVLDRDLHECPERLIEQENQD